MKNQFYNVKVNMTKPCHKFIYKLSSDRLKKARWDLNLPLESAMKNKNDIVALNDSQILRWICELNGTKDSESENLESENLESEDLESGNPKLEDLESEVASVQKEIKFIKKQPKSRENKNKIAKLYQKLYSLQYQKDYFCMIMNSGKDYDRANKGFKINGYEYHRLLGTNGGIKKSTIVYIGDNVFKEIIKRMDNGRDKTKPLIPAKLEAYQALICSASMPVTMPRILIVPDCNMTFKEDVIKISDEGDGEPQLTFEKNYEIEYCDSDGYGLMSPEYSRIINKDLHGDEFEGQTISGVNTRYAWTKGMLFTFDFVEFAKRVNHENYMVLDAWGERRDIRDYDVILTTSMVKLWDSYKSLEHFIQCCDENHYQFSVAKDMPHELENVRNSNYQFLQTYDFTEEELYKLCKPTIDEIKDVLGGDWRKAIVFAKGMYLNEDTVEYIENDFVKALMIDERLFEDPFVAGKLYSMIKKRIEMAAKGSVKLGGNFAMVSGDMYSLAQSIFGLQVTGLLKQGEVYHKYWIDKNVEDIAIFRAPMTCHNNIRKRKVVHDKEMDFWYQYNTTGIILNSWDSTCDATNGSDKDGDMFFSTDNKMIVEHTLNSATIECVQRKAEKIIPTENDIVQANKLAFGDEIGTTTNRITAMIERQSMFDRDSEEYKALDYRIMCGQHYQQNAIDRAKGIIAKPMPQYWYSKSACNKLPDDTEEQKRFKELCLKIVVETKPYFMKYVYPDLMARYNKYMKDTNSKCIREFKIALSDLIQKTDKTISEKEFIEYYKKLMPVGDNPCTINRIAWLFEDTFSSYLDGLEESAGAKRIRCGMPGRVYLKKYRENGSFDYSILKSGATYSNHDYQKIAKIKSEYDDSVKYFQQLANTRRLDKDEVSVNRNMMLLTFKAMCEEICPNEKELCDIIIDLCYSSSKSKQFAWDICGEVIIENLLDKNGHIINYPVLVPSDGEFEFGGEQFIMCQKKYEEDAL